MAKAPLPPPEQLAAVCPAIGKLAARGPIGPWDELPEILEVTLPIDHGFLPQVPDSAPCITWLQESFGLLVAPATQHVQLCYGNNSALVSAAEEQAVRESTKRPLRGEEYRYLHGAVHPLAKRARWTELLPQFDKERQTLQDAAVATYRAGKVAEAKAFIEAGWRAYRVRSAALPKLVVWWETLLLPNAPAQARCHVFPELPRSISLQMCLDTANMVDVRQGFPKMGKMPQGLYERAAAAAIIGGYWLEQGKLGQERQAIPLNAVHSKLSLILTDLSAYLPGNSDVRAAYVWARVPGLVLLSAAPKPGRGGSLQGLAACDPEAFIKFLDWGADLMKKSGRVADEPDVPDDVNDDSALESY